MGERIRAVKGLIKKPDPMKFQDPKRTMTSPLGGLLVIGDQGGHLSLDTAGPCPDLLRIFDAVNVKAVGLAVELNLQFVVGFDLGYF